METAQSVISLGLDLRAKAEMSIQSWQLWGEAEVATMDRSTKSVMGTVGRGKRV